MESGLTIAFVCLGKTHSTIESYKKFGDKYWDDALNNKSKIGYYFAYYYQQKYVYIWCALHSKISSVKHEFLVI
jgi:hypothetical protein